MTVRELKLPTETGTIRTFTYIVGRYATKIVGIGVFQNARIGYCTDVSMDTFKVTPKDIRKAILSSPKCPEDVKEPFSWDKPEVEQKPKKVDPGPRTRGFANLQGQTIHNFDATCLNSVKLYLGYGQAAELTAEVENGIPVIRCSVTKS